MLKNIKAIGFDLDQTLYPPNSEIDDLIRNEIARRILERKPELGDIKTTRLVYEQKHKTTGSWVGILKEEGFEKPDELLNEWFSFVNPGIVYLIPKDEVLRDIMSFLKKKYSLFLITNTPEDLSIPRLNKIGLEKTLFDYALFGSDPDFGSKAKGTPFKNLLNKSPYKPDEHVYVGDSLKADILPAKSYGMKTISVGSYIQEADFSIQSIKDITCLFEEHGE